jgi:hypothetical protein
MTYATLKREMGKEFVAIVELYLDHCVNVFGVAPCTAVEGAAGKCFNTLKTCQDLENYDRGAVADRKVLRFATTEIPGLQAAGDSPTFPTLRSVDTAPTRLDPGKGLGVRALVSITLQDHPWTDVGMDPYVRDRDYVPDNRGTLWGKILARYPNYEGRRVDILTGFLDDGVYNAANFLRRTYLINRIAGPTSAGAVTIEAKDPLKAADADRAQYPALTRAKLSSACLITDTELEVADPDAYIQTEVAAGQPYIRVGNEILEVTSVIDNGSGYYTVVVDRATAPAIYEDALNVVAAHEVGAAVQPCPYFDAVRIDTIAATLCEACGIDPEYTPTTQWEDRILEGGLESYVLSALIATPTPVKDLLTELTQHGIMMWWDERDSSIQMRPLIPQAFDGDAMNQDENIIANSVAVTRSTSERVSQVRLYFGLRFPTLDMKLLVSYAAAEYRVDEAAESAIEYGQSRIMDIYSRWLPFAKRSTAAQIGQRLLQSYRDTKIMVALSLDPKDSDTWTGDIMGVDVDLVQDETGANLVQNYTVLEVSEEISDSGISYAYQLQADTTLLRVGLIAPDLYVENVVFGGVQVTFDGDDVYWSGTGGDPFPDYDDASDYQRSTFAFIAPNDGFFPDGTPAYEIQ